MSSKRAQKTRTEILDAAWDLVATHGTEVSMAQIAKAVGVSRQAVYLHFSSRGGLLVALVQRADDRFEVIQTFDAAMAETDPRQRISVFFNGWFEFVEKVLPVASDLIRLQKTDKDATLAWEGRMEILYQGILALAKSLEADAVLGAGWHSGEAADYMYAVASMQVWELMTRARGTNIARARSILCSALISALCNPIEVN